MKTIIKKELSHYFNRPFGYIVIALFALFANFLFVKDIFLIGSASMRPFFSLASWLLVLFVPALTMRVFAEEKHSRTIESLLTLPVSEKDILLGKFIAVLAVIGVALVLTLGLSISLAFTSKLYLPEIIVGYIGLLLLAALFMSIGFYFSLLTENQIVAFLTTAVTLFIVFSLSSDFISSVVPRELTDAVITYVPSYHLDNFIKGVVNISSLFYFLSLTSLMLFISHITLTQRD